MSRAVCPSRGIYSSKLVCYQLPSVRRGHRRRKVTRRRRSAGILAVGRDRDGYIARSILSPYWSARRLLTELGLERLEPLMRPRLDCAAQSHRASA